jgi:hypothetical protein
MTDCKEKQSKEQQIFLMQKLCLRFKKFASSGLSDIYVNLFCGFLFYWQDGGPDPFYAYKVRS